MKVLLLKMDQVTASGVKLVNKVLAAQELPQGI